MKRLLLVLTLLMLAGCNTIRNPIVIPIGKTDNPSQKIKVNIDARLLNDCGPLPFYNGESESDTLLYVGDIAKIYADCASAKNSLNSVVKDAFNLNK